MAERPARNGRVRNSWYRVHRVLGLVSALFVLLLALTGLALNHTHRLDLDDRHVAPDWLLDWYGVRAAPEPVSYEAGGRRVTRLGRQLWVGSEPVLERVPALAGAVESGRFLVAALGGEVALFTADGSLVERLGPEAGVPGGIQRMGALEDGGIVVETPRGAFRTDAAFGGWQPAAVDGADWSRPSTLPAELRRRLERAWRGRGLTLERVLLDLHSGRVLGRFGVWLMDAMAAIFVFLAATGLWIWTRRRNGPRRARRRGPN